MTKRKRNGPAGTSSRAEQEADGRTVNDHQPTETITTGGSPAKGAPIDWALAYAKAGRKIIPCYYDKKSGRKPPKIGCDKDENGQDIPNTGGVYQATCDLEQVRALWTKWPDALIGMPTGSANGYDVLDLDVKEKGGKKIDGHLAVPNWKTLSPIIVTTRRGGHHLYFRHNPEQELKNWSNKTAPGLDIRTTGGYVILPDGREYTQHTGDICNPPELLQDFPMSLLDTPGKAPKAQGNTKAGTTQHGDEGHEGTRADVAKQFLRDQVAIIAGTIEGEGRNSVLNEASYSLGTLVKAGDLTEVEVIDALMAACEANGYTKKDGAKQARDTIGSGLRSGANKGELDKRFLALLEVGDGVLPPDAQDSLARKLVEKHERELRFDAEIGRWFRWTGKVWKQEKPLHVYSLANKLCRDIAKGFKSKSIKKELLKSSTFAAVERIASGMLLASGIEWDADPWLLNTPGGVVNLRTGVLGPHDPELYMTKLAKVTPADTDECPKYRAFANWVTCEDAAFEEYLRRVDSYCLTGDAGLQEWWFNHGDGGTGKGTRLGVLLKVLGDYAVETDPTTLTLSGTNQHRTFLASLRGARLVVCEEVPEDQKLNMALINRMTGGSKIMANLMRQDPFEYVPQFKLHCTSNFLPSTRIIDNAVRRRLNMVPFKAEPPERDQIDVNLMRDIIEQEGGQVLRLWINTLAARGDEPLKRWLSPAGQVLSSTKAFFSESDTIGTWLTDCTNKVDASKWTPQDEAHRSFTGHWVNDGKAALSKNEFTLELEKRGFPKDRRPLNGKKPMCFIGLEVVPSRVNSGETSENRVVQEVFKGAQGREAF